jgi:biopolymer transport protein ExbB/TolQ
MSGPRSPVANQAAVRPTRRARISTAAFLFGIPLGAAILALIHFSPLQDTTARRYVSHPVECVEVFMFCCALAALGAKLWAYATERRACRTVVLSPWSGQVVPISDSGKLLTELNRFPARFQNTLMAKRLAAVLDFLRSRGSPDQLDDQLRALADTDALTLEGSYSLTRLITWAIPILGFLGTVLGITGAISGVTPEVLENSLSTVTDGLALAFDTTALALGLTMVTMFLSYIVERAEQGVLDTVDRYVEQELAHRFERVGVEESQILGVMRQQSDALFRTVEHLVERQTVLWAKTFQEADRQRVDSDQRQQERFRASLEAALEKTLDSHTRRLADLERQAIDQSGRLMEQLAKLAVTIQTTSQQQQAALVQVSQRVTQQVEALAGLQEGDKQLRHLQEMLNQNLASLAGAGSFEQAIHSLTAAIHLMTARASSGTVPVAARSGDRAITGIGPRPGAAA